MAEGIAPIHYSEIRLDHIALYSRHTIPAGLYREQFHMAMEYMSDALVGTLSAYAMGEDAGPRQQEIGTWAEKVKPKYMPKWLWNRLDVEWHKVTVNVHPQYIYPESSIKVEELRRPVRIMKMDPVKEGHVYRL